MSQLTYTAHPGDELFISDYLAGMTIRAVAAKHGVTDHSVRRALIASGTPFRAIGPTRRFGPALELEIATAYQSASSAQEVAARYGCSGEHVLGIVYRIGLPTVPVAERNRGRSLIPGLARRGVDVIRDYFGGEHLRVVAERYGVSVSTLKAFIHYCGLTPHPTGGRTTRSANHAAFDTLTPEAAYWIGFLMADGCVSDTLPGAPVVVLALAAKDADHVKRFREFLHSDHKVTVTPAGAHVLAVRSAPLAAALARYGVVPRKSLTATATGLEHDPHFWRGVVDGDGSVLLCKRPNGWRPTPSLRLYGSWPLTHQFRSFVQRLTPHTRANVFWTGTIYSFSTVGHAAAAIAGRLYHAGDIALPRKANTAAMFVGWQFSRSPDGKWLAAR